MNIKVLKMIVKVVVEVDQNTFSKLIGVDETNDFFEEAIKIWKNKCNGAKHSNQMFELLDNILSEYNIEYFDYEKNIDEIIKAKA